MQPHTNHGKPISVGAIVDGPNGAPCVDILWTTVDGKTESVQVPLDDVAHLVSYLVGAAVEASANAGFDQAVAEQPCAGPGPDGTH